jgi:DNA-binding HxlR family transcriptional regulator
VRSDLIAAQNCSIARAAALIGDAWTILMIREAHGGATRYADFEQNTGAPRSTVADRLRRLLQAGILERYEYSQHPPARATA